LDVTDITHQSVKDIATAVIRAIPGLEWAGLDLMSRDITALQTADSYVVLEINASAMLGIYDFPEQGVYRHVTEEFFKLMFPKIDWSAPK